MDFEIEELENFFSQHFGWTPNSTPAASQVTDHENSSDDTDDDGPADDTIDLDRRVMQFLDDAVVSDPNSDDGDGDDDENDYQRSSASIENVPLPHDDPNLFKIRDVKIRGCGSAKKRQNGERKKIRSEQTFMFSGEKVCRNTFLLVYDIGKHFLHNIITHKNTHGVTPRKHGNLGKKPSHSLQYDDIKLVVQFISSYADDFGLPQPAAPRGRDDTPSIYIPSDTTKKDVHEKYVESCPNDRHVRYSTFCNIWNQCLPHIRIAKPRDDVCATCEKLRKSVLDAVSEEEKLEAAPRKMQKHITHTQAKRKVYNDCVKRSRDTYRLQDRFTLRKVHIFGVRSDGEPKQLNFLINENETIGPDGTKVHGPDSVISMLDWALQNHNSDETSCTIHADNCCGQNKNQYVIGYLMWRVMTKQHNRIEFKMQIPGHARCLIDGGFALLKKLYRRCDCDSIGQLEDVVNRSSTTNTAVRYPAWQWRSWKEYLGQFFKPVKGIRQYCAQGQGNFSSPVVNCYLLN
uniref:DUF7869 domain-containing protein n=1 Tax=Magallana gigas TaxID=29159 RepID=A0A8W8N980_MAGGI